MQVAKNAQVITGVALAVLLFGYALTMAQSRGVAWLAAVENPLVLGSSAKLATIEQTLHQTQSELTMTRQALTEAEGYSALQAQAVAAVGQQLETIYVAHAQQVKQLKSTHEQVVLEKNLQHEEALQGIKAEHHASTMALKAAHAEETASLRAQFEEAHEQASHLQQRLTQVEHERTTLEGALALARQVRPAGLFRTAVRGENDGKWTFSGAYNVTKSEGNELGLETGNFVVAVEPGTQVTAPGTLTLQVISPTGQVVHTDTAPVDLTRADHVVFPYAVKLSEFGVYSFAIKLDGQQAGALTLQVTRP